METKSRFLKLKGIKHVDSQNQPLHGDILKDDNTILRFRNGFLDGGIYPAVECTDTHREYWLQGKISRFDGPAIISNHGEWKEFWEDGHVITVNGVLLNE